VKLWKFTYEKEEVDPFSINIKYFTYTTDPFLKLLEGAEQQFYSYGLEDLQIDEVIAALYRPEETVPETQVNLIHSYIEEARRSRLPLTFETMLQHMTNYSQFDVSDILDAISTPPQRRNRRQSRIISRWGSTPILDNWHKATAGAVARRLRGFLDRATHIIVRNAAKGNPIKFSAIEPYKIHVVQLYGLADAEKRIVVNALLREVSNGLASQEEGNERIKRILFLIDELNLYAPKIASPIKERIIDISARGRDLRLSLIGIQQFASQIDTQVYGNCATKIVGNSDIVEVRSTAYNYLGAFKDTVTLLDKGELITYHPTYTSPMPIIFPVPLHQVTKNAK